MPVAPPSRRWWSKMPVFGGLCFFPLLVLEVEWSPPDLQRDLIHSLFSLLARRGSSGGEESRRCSSGVGPHAAWRSWLLSSPPFCCQTWEQLRLHSSHPHTNQNWGAVLAMPGEEDRDVSEDGKRLDGFAHWGMSPQRWPNEILKRLLLKQWQAAGQWCVVQIQKLCSKQGLLILCYGSLWKSGEAFILLGIRSFKGIK